MSIDVIGMKTFTAPDSILMSPGSLPNQANSQGANCNITPMSSRIAPSMINHFAMRLPGSLCLAGHGASNRVLHRWYSRHAAESQRWSPL